MSLETCTRGKISRWGSRPGGRDRSPPQSPGVSSDSQSEFCLADVTQTVRGRLEAPYRGEEPAGGARRAHVPGRADSLFHRLHHRTYDILEAPGREEGEIPCAYMRRTSRGWVAGPQGRAEGSAASTSPGPRSRSPAGLAQCEQGFSRRGD